jgi:ferredoxin
MAKIIHEREKCIGCGSCTALCPKFFEMADDGKAKLIEGQKNAEGNDELEVEEVGCAQEAADACPVQIIHIIK